MGMEIENHSFTHADLGNGGPIATTEMRNATRRIRAVIGYTPCIFRPPFAVQNADLIRRARSLGMSTVGRDVDPFDWQEPGTDAIVSRVLDRTRPGSIINMHDGGGTRSQTVAALPRIIKGLRDRGYRMTTVSKLLGYRPTFAR
jgi:peptidoglycan/xylan/chitin deacetylase (PgdA/CDA1 family)